MRSLTVLACAALMSAVIPAAAQQSNPLDAAPRAAAPARSQCGFLGIYPDDVRTASRAEGGSRVEGGAVVLGVVASTGAERAGLLEKDVIVTFNGTAVRGEHHLRQMVIATAPGTMVPIEIDRNGGRTIVSAEITKRLDACGCDSRSIEQRRHEIRQLPEMNADVRERLREYGLSAEQMKDFDKQLEQAREELSKAGKELRITMKKLEATPGLPGEPLIGVAVQRVTPQLAKYFKLPGTTGGLVAEVKEKSPAEAAGVQAGDVIVAVNGEAVGGPVETARSIRLDRDGSVDLKIIRDGNEQTITVRTGSTPSSEPKVEALPSLPGADIE